MDFSKLSREDWMVGGGAIVLIIDLLFLCRGTRIARPFDAARGPTRRAAIWGVLALIVTIVVLVDLALARFSPATQIPTTQLGRDLTRAAIAAVALLFVIIKLIDNTSYLAYGTWVGLILAVVIVAGAWLNAQGKATPTGKASV